MSKFVRGLIGLIVGYGAGLALGLVAIGAFSTNTHDKSVEMAVTSALVTGPICAVIGCIWAVVRGGDRA